MDFLDSSLASPSVPSDPVVPLRLKRKRGPAASDRPEPALGEPLLEGLSLEEDGRPVSLLDRVRKFATLCLWLEDGSDQLLTPAEDRQPGMLSRLATSLRRTVRNCCEAVINAFIWSSQVKPY